jgi:hypothetical protein
MIFLERAPIWLVGLVMLAALALVHELGYQGGRRMDTHEASGDGKGHLVASALALLGLMMAFTFSAAQDRFNLRQHMVVEEANALGTTYLRIQTLDPPGRDILSQQMLQYAQVREKYFAASSHPDRLAENTNETSALQDRMWPEVTSAVRTNSVPTLNGPLLQAVNDMFDLAASRRAALDARVPVSILRMLAIYALAAATIMGFAGGSGKDRRYGAVSTAVLLLLTMAFCLILDLDRPSSGTITINQSSMTRAVAAIRQAEAAKAASGQINDPASGIQLPRR